MSFFYETHLHTSEGSACAVSSGEEMVRYYHRLGYRGIIVTDHFFNGNTAVDRSLPWPEKVAALCRGYENAQRYGQALGVDVFFGWEYSVNGNDFLTYGLDKDWLTAHPEVMSISLRNYLQLVRSSGALVIHAHPFRLMPYTEMIRLLPDFVDAVEVRNGGDTQTPEFDARAAWYAAEYKLPAVAGTDIHSDTAPVSGGLAFSRPLTDISDFIRLVKKGDFTLAPAMLPARPADETDV